jgi:hypothetical protein
MPSANDFGFAQTFLQTELLHEHGQKFGRASAAFCHPNWLRQAAPFLNDDSAEGRAHSVSTIVNPGS